MKNTIMMKYAMVLLVITSFIPMHGSSEPNGSAASILRSGFSLGLACGIGGQSVAIFKDILCKAYQHEPYDPYRFMPMYRCMSKCVVVGFVGGVGAELLAIHTKQQRRDDARS